jgi:hypothetical protein
VRQAYNRLAQVQVARAKARDEADGDSLTYARKIAVAEARLFERWGALPMGTADEIAREVQDAPLDMLKKGLAAMRNDAAPDAYRDITTDGARYLERQPS